MQIGKILKLRDELPSAKENRLAERKERTLDDKSDISCEKSHPASRMTLFLSHIITVMPYRLFFMKQD